VVDVGDLGVLRSQASESPTVSVSEISKVLVHLARSGAAEDDGPPAPSALADFESLAAAREDFERRYIASKHQACHGNMSRTAEALGVERSYLYKKMKALGLIASKKGAELSGS
jgi:DNA-binding NtrC family response regulator